MGLPIDIHYDKWARFENFLQFAEKKEIKDRLKELDPPPMSNYVESDTIDNIHKMRRKNHSKPPKAPRDENAGSEHVARIAKMKEMYSLFVRMENEQPHTESINFRFPDVPTSPRS